MSPSSPTSCRRHQHVKTSSPEQKISPSPLPLLLTPPTPMFPPRPKPTPLDSSFLLHLGLNAAAQELPVEHCRHRSLKIPPLVPRLVDFKAHILQQLPRRDSAAFVRFPRHVRHQLALGVKNGQFRGSFRFGLGDNSFGPPASSRHHD